MKGNEKVIEHLNTRLAEELTAINQYMVHAEMCEDWGYKKLGERIEKRAITEMKHAEALIARILFLEGRPIVSNLNKINIGSDVPEMHKNDHGLELVAVKGYNDTIRLCAEVGDHNTKTFIQGILKDEIEHVDDIESQLDQLEQVGVENYLTQQIG